LWRIGGDVREVLRFWKTCSHSSFQNNFADLLSSWKMGWVCSANLGRKWEMVVKRSMIRYTSLILLGLRISMIALHFSGFALMPRCVSMKPRNLPRSTPKMHFSGLSLRLYCRNAENTVDKSCACYWWLGDLTTMSSTYTSTHLAIMWLKTLSINH